LQRAANRGNEESGESLVYWELFKTNNSLVDSYPGENGYNVTNVKVNMLIRKFIELVSIPAIVTS